MALEKVYNLYIVHAIAILINPLEPGIFFPSIFEILAKLPTDW